MFGMPLHPLVVHFPIVLVVLLPVFAGVTLWNIRRAPTSSRAWLATVALAGALALSAFVAQQTGESQEDRVERVVARGAIHGHEEAAERFVVLSGVLFLISLSGLSRGTLGSAGRLLTTAGAVGLVAAGVQVGHSGGQLVYRDGAASAYTTPANVRTAQRPPASSSIRAEEHEAQ
jgi:uncharacterized membrane protein